ncbi:hypothetical protein ACGFMK_28025 [Amycolatopsis sp. NPDC049252]|uniref:hypothetical protein n=1 Tax=Amycolatopsis sp. NPDC049252 TaxID=3363933 RepID=UPI003714DF86
MSTLPVVARPTIAPGKDAIMRVRQRSHDPPALHGRRPGALPAHPSEPWTGAQGPKALALTGRIGGGRPSPIPVPPAVREAGVGASPSWSARSPAPWGAPGRARLGTGTGNGGAVGDWLTRLAAEQPFTGLGFWSEGRRPGQVVRLARDMARR